jgi:hypothetical protein
MISICIATQERYHNVINDYLIMNIYRIDWSCNLINLDQTLGGWKLEFQRTAWPLNYDRQLPSGLHQNVSALIVKRFIHDPIQTYEFLVQILKKSFCLHRESPWLQIALRWSQLKQNPGIVLLAWLLHRGQQAASSRIENRILTPKIISKLLKVGSSKYLLSTSVPVYRQNFDSIPQKILRIQLLGWSVGVGPYWLNCLIVKLMPFEKPYLTYVHTVPTSQKKEIENYGV